MANRELPTLAELRQWTREAVALYFEPVTSLVASVRAVFRRGAR